MLSQLNICKRCVSKLGKYGNMPLEYYVLICEIYSDYDSFLVESGQKGYGDTILRFLEKKHFIVTTDYDKDKLSIKPIGYSKKRYRYLESHTVCAFQEEHNKKGKPTEIDLPQH